MELLTEKQIQIVIDWMNGWEQLKNTSIPMRFKEDFTTEKTAQALRSPRMSSDHPQDVSR